eukprot:GHVS01077950.1.p2 GENE.GHVS01077950.1~~GHVS01077950.1.p2  ORF type:complete len:107 (-),score=7.18 GHVS01077950.1:81-401(-)
MNFMTASRVLGVYCSSCSSNSKHADYNGNATPHEYARRHTTPSTHADNMWFSRRVHEGASTRHTLWPPTSISAAATVSGRTGQPLCLLSTASTCPPCRRPHSASTP